MLSARPGVGRSFFFKGARVRGRCPNRFLVYRYAPVCDVRKSRKVGHVSHVCVGMAYRVP